ncbi:hypothetical protein Cpir12675_006073 [Ceratocystis pirilliformis]|uniref:Histone chaperone RTT106/FACT complex subunit SPT16-like middle domain-containing protein n=1 Tax=Ceratocystis pirilliformis TaxID=259994 RepID=A0ABR3YKK5_9PEZI
MASPSLDSRTLSLVFQAKPDIVTRIQRAADTPDHISLFNDIANFFYDQLHSSDEPSSKRRKTETPSTPNGIVSVTSEPVQLEIKEISLSVPVRKKLDLCFTSSGLYGRASGSKEAVPGTVFSWSDIEFAFYLPVPEKTQVQHNYVLLPRGSSFITKATPTPDPLVFTVNATPPKAGTISGPKAAAAQPVSGDYNSLFDWSFSTFLRSAGSNVQIVASNPARFHSMVKQSHRPNEKAVHIKAFRGSKDGYLFFLQTGILWGFKKPLLYIPLERVAAISYTSVLQRTFNMVVEVFSGEGDNTEEIEFSMIDQQDYQGIDELYVKKNGLQDRSMAEQRKAKLELAENAKAVKNDGGDDGSEDVEMTQADEDATVAMNPALKHMTALERAEWEEEQRLQDEEDEEEEDYNPESGDDSDGSGESNDEDSDDMDSDANDDDDDDDDDEEGDEEGDGDEDEKEQQNQQQQQKQPTTRVGGWAALNK